MVDEDDRVHPHRSRRVQCHTDITRCRNHELRFRRHSDNPEDLTKTAELLARTRGGAAEDYESDLTITGASDIAAIAVTARARTPGAATALANDAARALSSYLNDMPTTTENKITYRVSFAS